MMKTKYEMNFNGFRTVELRNVIEVEGKKILIENVVDHSPFLNIFVAFGSKVFSWNNILMLDPSYEDFEECDGVVTLMGSFSNFSRNTRKFILLHELGHIVGNNGLPSCGEEMYKYNLNQLYYEHNADQYAIDRLGTIVSYEALKEVRDYYVSRMVWAECFDEYIAANKWINFDFEGSINMLEERMKLCVKEEQKVG